MIQGNKKQAGTVTKIPAGEIENLVKKELYTLLKDTNNIQQYISTLDIHKQNFILSNLSNFELRSDYIRSILAKVVLFKDKVEIILCKDQVIKYLGSIVTNSQLIEESKNDPADPIIITKEIRIATTSRNGSVLIVKDEPTQEININPFLVKVITQSYHWNKLIEEGKAQNSKDIQRMENHNNNSYIKEVLRLKFLSPDIVEKILNGTQPRDLTADKLRKIKTVDWEEQRKILNF